LGLEISISQISMTFSAISICHRSACTTKPIKIVVPFPAGGTSDVLARILGQKMTESWGQPVVPC
jgi:tripartite-type tricarboxylate transporter receptor subunit TctC